MIKQEQIEQIRKRCEAATPGPWRVPEGYSWRVAEGDTYICNMFGRQDLQDSENAKFIAHARTDIPLLLDEIDRLRAELNEANNDFCEVVAERDAMERAVRGHCFSCINAKPAKGKDGYKRFPSLIVCDYMNEGLFATNGIGKRNCDNWIFDLVRFSGEGGEAG